MHEHTIQLQRILLQNDDDTMDKACRTLSLFVRETPGDHFGKLFFKIYF